MATPPRTIRRWPRQGLLRIVRSQKIRSGHGTTRLSRVLLAIARKGTPEAEQLLYKLAGSKPFLADSHREEDLVAAIATFPTATEKVVAYLGSVGGPKREYLNDAAVEALCRYRTPQVLAILEKWVGSPRFHEFFRSYWCCWQLYRYRTDPAMVDFYGRLLRSEIDSGKVRDRIVQSLFDFRPVLWHLQDTPNLPNPPRWEDASPEVLRQLLTLADVALALQMTPQKKEAVEKSRAEITAALAVKPEKK